MKTTRRIALAAAALATLSLLAACDSTHPVVTPDPGSGNLGLDVTGLEALGAGFVYEGWIIVDGAPVSTGRFTVTGGTPTPSAFDVEPDQLARATAFVLTIEPDPDPDPAPAATHLLAGDFSGSTAALSVGHGAAIGDSFGGAAGEFILATPTDGPDTNENSGLWFLNAGMPALVLPELPEGWEFEGWAVIDGTPVTTGRFTDPTGPDDAAPFSESVAAPPPLPGEDFLLNAPAGLSFPLDLSGQTAVVTVEPEPDDSPAPFTLKPLVGAIPAGAADHVPLGMENRAADFPTGTVTR